LYFPGNFEVSGKMKTPMSIQLIQQYHAQVEKIIRYGGTRKETAVRKPFHDLLEQYARQKNLELIGEFDYRGRRSNNTVL
jgi:predicted DNA-binding ribbon-helix-helix protein